MDAPPSVGSVESGTASPAATPGLIKRDPKRKKLVTAYILFSADVRKITMDENPGQKFGEISRIVADRWRQMSDADKQTYAERAKKLNEEKEEREGKRQEGDRIRLTEDRKQSTAPPQAASPGPPAPASPMGRSRQESGGAAAVSAQPTQIRQEPLFHSVPP